MAIELSDAVRALQNRFGPRLAGGQDEGRRLMAEALEEHFRVLRGEAKDLVQALEDAHTIRWVDERGGLATVPHAATPFAESLGAESPGGLPSSAGIPLGSGYWQLAVE
ncbi:MAG: hypothetical protein ACREUU_20950 [Gammaproteobacteria bacterium]